MGLEGTRMRALVTGGTGFLGKHLVRTLMARGASVRVLTRSHIKGRSLTERDVDVVVGGIDDLDALRLAVSDMEVIYHLAGKLFIQGTPAGEYERIHVEGTRALLATSQDSPDLRRFIHVSTTGVLGPTGDQPANEDAPTAPTNAYERSKLEAERLVGQAIQNGFPGIIVRPGLVYGPGDLHLLGFFRTIQRGLFRPIGSKPVWLHPIYVSDHTTALLSCTHNSKAVGECFHIAGEEPITIATLSSEIATAMGKKPPRGSVPLPVAWLAAAVNEVLPRRLKSLVPLPRSRLDFLTHSRIYDVSKARRLLGFTATTDLTGGMKRTVSWYRQQGYLPAA